MPSERYYRQQATALLSWARATHDKAWARILRQRAAYELERASDGRSAITDLNPLLDDFNEQLLRKVMTPDLRMDQPSPERPEESRSSPPPLTSAASSR
jgi:hypothetical protein